MSEYRMILKDEEEGISMECETIDGNCEYDFDTAKMVANVAATIVNSPDLFFYIVNALKDELNMGGDK